MTEDFTHLDANDNPTIVDVGSKAISKRTAKARSLIVLEDHVLNALKGSDFNSKKGPIFQTAIIAGIMAAKRTGELIPLCHPIGLENCKIDISITQNNEIEIICTASLTAKTGVEMEALVGASIAALTIYDMCKALSQNIIIKETRLIEKRGGKKDFKL